MTITEILWIALSIALTLVLLLLIGVLFLAIPMGAERQRRRNAAVDDDLEARKAQYPDGALRAEVESALAEGRVTPKTIQRFIDRKWLDRP